MLVKPAAAAPPAHGPFVHISTPGSAVVLWDTETNAPTVLDYRKPGEPFQTVAARENSLTHRVELVGLDSHQVYEFRVRLTQDRFSDLYTFDSSFDSNQAPHPMPESGFASSENSYSAWLAREIAGRTGCFKGYCVVLNLHDGSLIFELCKITRLKFIVLETDRSAIARWRSLFDGYGLYGTAVSIVKGSLDENPIPDYLANLVISEKPVDPEQIKTRLNGLTRLVRPAGGSVWLNLAEADGSWLEPWLNNLSEFDHTLYRDQKTFLRMVRNVLPGSGEWTHLYANPANTANSGDRRIVSDTEILWFGEPGPRLMIDRHHRPMPSLFKNGKLFIPANERVICVDAYNGTRYWDLCVPGFRRFGVLKDSGPMAVAGDALYLAYRDRCLVVDPTTGYPTRWFPLPDSGANQIESWGFIAYQDNYLVGSSQKPFASRYALSKDDVIEQYGDHKPLVTSQSLFVLNRATGAPQWTYMRDTIVNSSIVLTGQSVVFIESENPAAKEDPLGRVPLSVLTGWPPSYLTSINLETGKLEWRKPFDFSKCRHILYTSYADRTILVTGSHNHNDHPWYVLYGFDRLTGTKMWEQAFEYPAKAGGDHGEQVHHPVIDGDTIYAEPYAFDLRTGNRLPDFELVRDGHGCGTLSGCASFLFGRGNVPRVFDTRLDGKSNRPLTLSTRPGCWINIIPAGGLILMPESSSGCTCGYAIQTSVVLKPSAAPAGSSLSN